MAKSSDQVEDGEALTVAFNAGPLTGQIKRRYSPRSIAIGACASRRKPLRKILPA
jgi:hypothetical protein